MKVLDVKWASGAIGIVKARNNDGNVYIYIGAGVGINEREDIDRILDWGSKFTLDEFQKFVK